MSSRAERAPLLSLARCLSSWASLHSLLTNMGSCSQRKGSFCIEEGSRLGLPISVGTLSGAYYLSTGCTPCSRQLWWSKSRLIKKGLQFSPRSSYCGLGIWYGRFLQFIKFQLEWLWTHPRGPNCSQMRSITFPSIQVPGIPLRGIPAGQFGTYNHLWLKSPSSWRQNL